MAAYVPLPLYCCPCFQVGTGPANQHHFVPLQDEAHTASLTILLPVEGHPSLTSEGIRDRVPCLGMPRLAQETLSHLAFSTVWTEFGPTVAMEIPDFREKLMCP